MELKLIRSRSTAQSTIGELSVDGVFECYTLEDVVRPKKIAGKTAIPAGRYAVTVNFSPRFQRDLPLLLDVPNYQGLRIHSGNTAKDTKGCILVGRTRADDAIGESRLALGALLPKLQAALAAGAPVYITIEDSPPT